MNNGQDRQQKDITTGQETEESVGRIKRLLVDRDRMKIDMIGI